MTSGATYTYIIFFSHVNFMGILVLVGLSGKVEAVLLFFFLFSSAFLSLIPVYGLWKMVSDQPDTPKFTCRSTGNCWVDDKATHGWKLKRSHRVSNGNVVCLRGVRDPHGVFISFSLSVSWPRLALIGQDRIGILERCATIRGIVLTF